MADAIPPALLVGCVLAHCLRFLPSPLWIAPVLALSLLGTQCLRRPVGLPLLALVVGFMWVWAHAAWRIAGRPADELLQRQISVQAIVASVPRVTGGAARALFDLRQASGRPLRHRVRLTWYRAPPGLAPGQRWQLEVKLFRPRGMVNPGAPDFERWMFQQNIVATGYVIDPPGRDADVVTAGGNWLLAATAGHRGWLLRQRVRLAQELAASLDRTAPALAHNAALIGGLAVGLRERLSPEQWRLLRETGTSHLMAVSGLHIGLVAGLALLAGRWIGGRFSPTPGRGLAPLDVGYLLGMLAAAIYAAMAGFAMPTRRALVMLGLILVARLLRRHSRAIAVLGRALAGVLLIDPFAPLSAGFWLSFCAVAILLLDLARQSRPGLAGRIWQAARIQLRLSIGLLPCGLAYFGMFSAVGPVANLLVVPLFALLVVPLVLLAAAAQALGGADLSIIVDPLLWAAAFALEAVMRLLGWLAALPIAARELHLRWPQLMLMQGGCLLLLWPRAVSGALAAIPHLHCSRRLRAVICLLGVVLLALTLNWPSPRPPRGAIRVAVLDVGQGLAAVVQTSSRTLLYDAGPRFRSGADSGELAVLPFLRAFGVRRLDAIFVSHGDNDHRGGLAAVRERFPHAPVYAGEPRDDERPCAGMAAWRWDGIEFGILHPAYGAQQQPPGGGAEAPDRHRRPAPLAWHGNDASCVLRIRGPSGAVMLPGDIERAAEAALLRSGQSLRADVLVAPHHGSATSSGAGLVSAVRPRLVIYAAARGNRWRFPAAEVASRWAASGADALQTGEEGAIMVELGPRPGPLRIERERARRRRYWHPD